MHVFKNIRVIQNTKHKIPVLKKIKNHHTHDIIGELSLSDNGMDVGMICYFL